VIKISQAKTPTTGAAYVVSNVPDTLASLDLTFSPQDSQVIFTLNSIWKKKLQTK